MQAIIMKGILILKPKIWINEKSAYKADFLELFNK